MNVAIQSFGVAEYVPVAVECPTCGRGANFTPTPFKDLAVGNNYIIGLRHCPFPDCRGYLFFISQNRKLVHLHPPAKGRSFGEVIANLSPSFCEIFVQAARADETGLDLICGVGYRKALEFLIKDFAISEHPTQKDAILKTQLGPCIEKYIDDPRVKESAKRATWLGNDETHYVRKWPDKELSHLKDLIEITLNFIEIVKRSQKYLGEMP